VIGLLFRDVLLQVVLHAVYTLTYQGLTISIRNYRLSEYYYYIIKVEESATKMSAVFHFNKRNQDSHNLVLGIGLLSVTVLHCAARASASVTLLSSDPDFRSHYTSRRWDESLR